MSQRTIKNYTDEDLIIADLGDIIIPANGAADLGGDERTLMDLASSDDLLKALAQGVEKYQVFDGLRNLPFSQGIDLIRKIQRPTEVDELGRWVVRSDSRKSGWDTAFQGQGDNLATGKIGDGTPFRFDCSVPPEDTRWLTPDEDPTIPDGFARQRIDWFFCDWTFAKEGTIYFYDVPKGSYCDFWLVAPPGAVFNRKKLDAQQEVQSFNFPSGNRFVKFMHWVIKYPIEGNAPMGDELNTESAAGTPAYPGLIWRAEFTVPKVDGWEKAHGHWSLEMYRIAQDRYDIPEQYW